MAETFIHPVLISHLSFSHPAQEGLRAGEGGKVSDAIGWMLVQMLGLFGGVAFLQHFKFEFLGVGGWERCSALCLDDGGGVCLISLLAVCMGAFVDREGRGPGCLLGLLLLLSCRLPGGFSHRSQRHWWWRRDKGTEVLG